MRQVSAFLDELARRLVPACDRSVVHAVFSCASAGYGGARGRDGRRVSIITPSGVPFEASVTGGAGRSSAAVRYVTEAATAMPFFGPRLAAQRAALDQLVGWLPAPARAAADGLREAVDLFFPDPALVPARTRFATTFGIVHRAEVPDGLAALKLYGNLGVDDAAAARLAGRWPAFAGLRDVVADLDFLSPHFATLEVDAGGRLAHKLYARTRRANAAALSLLARRFGTDIADLSDELGRAGVDGTVWRRPVFVCVETGGGEGDGPEVSVHLPAKALGLDAPGMARLARQLVGAHADARAVDALDGAVELAGGPEAWHTSVVGVGLAAGGGVGKVNVYAAALAPAGLVRDESPSNSGWIGDRVMP